MNIQDCPIQTDFFVLPAALFQVVLGIQWLEMLEPIETNYRKLTMKFQFNSRTHVILGIRRAFISMMEASDLYAIYSVVYFLVISAEAHEIP